ncbi:c-type cytochrome [Motiliproteus coralliicola]|uniref:c-type cytochrome n=1 Tax=Motiliproteus coralliicola TaxID=2283196 RepID=UPI001A9E6EC5|nr:c-type cytochrome [Motiliproteus coralliicola]
MQTRPIVPSTIIATLLGTLLLPAGADASSVLEQRLATANPEKGAKLFRLCAACHSINNGGENKIGPNLYALIGRKIATHAGFGYSDAMKEQGGNWTLERLDRFLADPGSTVKGTRMTFAGLKKDRDRADLIAYMNSQSSAPLSFIGSASSEAKATTATEASTFGLLVPAPGVEVTYYTCTACHSERLVVQQGLTRTGWEEIFDWVIQEQGMAEPSAEDRQTILNYLTAHYNTDRPNAPKNSNATATTTLTAPQEQLPDGAGTEASEYGVLFPAPGVDTTYYACTACHSERIIAQQGQTREGWDEVIDWMIDEQGLDKLDDADRTVILDYLSTHYGPDRKHFVK